MRENTPSTFRIGRALACLCVSALLAAAAAPPAHAQPGYTAAVVFGDSLSDVGNTANNAFLSIVAPQAQPPYHMGRFSNAPVWAEHLADRLGLDASTRSGVGGLNYAEGGARSGSGTNVFGAIDNMGTQVGNYLDDHNAAGSELFMLWGGGNDFIEFGGSLGGLFSGGGTPQGVAANMADHVQRLALDGGTSFLVLNMPDLGRIPRYLGTPEQQQLSATAAQYNTLLAAEMDTLSTQYAIDIDLLDIAALFDMMLDDPGRYGFTNTTDPAYDADSGTVVADPSGYAFWDEIHPADLAHRWIATAAWVELQLDGDLTGDGYVGIDDLDLLLANWGRTVTPFDLTRGDRTGDGTVGQADLDHVLNHWGRGTPPTTHIPEPGTAVVVMLVTVWGGRRRGRRG